MQVFKVKGTVQDWLTEKADNLGFLITVSDSKDNMVYPVYRQNDKILRSESVLAMLVMYFGVQHTVRKGKFHLPHYIPFNIVIIDKMF